MTTALSCPVPDTRGPAPLTQAGFSFYPTTVSITKAAADSAHCERVQQMFPTKSNNNDASNQGWQELVTSSRAYAERHLQRQRHLLRPGQECEFPGAAPRAPATAQSARGVQDRSCRGWCPVSVTCPRSPSSGVCHLGHLAGVCHLPWSPGGAVG